MVFKYMTPDQVRTFLPEIIKNNVSEIARSPDGFTTAFLSGQPLSKDFALKRHQFISRTLPAYNNNPTYRRMLSLIAWSFMPSIKVPPHKY